MLPRIFFRYNTARSFFNGIIALTCFLLTLMAIAFSWRRNHGLKVKAPLTSQNVKRLRLEHTNTTKSSEKIISMLHFPSYYELKMGGIHFEHCKIKTCTLTDNPDHLTTSDAVMFYTPVKPITPPPKTPGQIWVYFVEESPLHSRTELFGGPEWENLINWTMTYRKDSDIVFGYGVVHNKTERGPQKDYYAIAKAKTKLIAWFVSNCNTKSQRMKYVKLLQKFVPVDVYGDCGSLKCPKNKEIGCIEMLNTDYKFYLSFENSLCLDYVTEKLYRMLKYDVIPIARGWANYSKYLPNKSVISTSDFFTVRDLAELIKHLDSNMDEYLKYFSWKSSYSIEEPQAMPLCEICEKVHNPEKWHNIYKNVADWWRTGTCHDPTDLVSEL
ncbi:alpha-(1,3)-fucosyltransferase C-like [Gigantopelta aegis]|uniref:alpha-(1,3)-fucosyltransferase C-like n=1 Tax=Gigantopelta aegis TaxID=1735272 RepID=UPI001B88E05F|nr:alpha-(1,3)-fucosyltransferase C-like [Gigantopelta aegis]